LNAELYKQREDKAFEDSINQFGILKPLVVTPNHVIISGARRWRAALKLGFDKVPCEVKEFEDEERAVIEYNRYRNKTPREIANEYRKIQEKLAPEAKERQLTQLKQHKDEEDSRFVQTTKTEDAKAIHIREIAAKQLNVSETQLHRISYIYDHQEEAKGIVEKLDRGEISVFQAYNEVKTQVEKAPEPTKPKSPESWKCPVCQKEYVVETPVNRKMCPYCDAMFQTWKATRDYEKQLAAMG
jgi:ParB family chromosome partitioning protein